MATKGSTQVKETQKDYPQRCLELFKKIQQKGSVWKSKADYEKYDGEQYEDMIQKMKTKMVIFNDPIHGSIQLNPLETAIVNTPEFYRLKNIKQLGGKNHVYPGAIHTRFEHSIGVCHLAGRMIKHLRERSGSAVTTEELKEEELCVRLAGLCHDLGHGPFSHLFEKLAKKICDGWEKHEIISTKIFKSMIVENPKVTMMFVKCGLDYNHVKMICDMIEGDREKPKGKEFLYEIVASKKNGIDVDKWDYFARDCHHLGLKNEFDMERCLALSSIVKCEEERHLGFRDKEKTNIYGMFRTRCVLHQKAYNHTKGNGIDMMISDALYEGRNIKFQVVAPSSSKSADAVAISLKEILHKAKENDFSQYILLTDSILSTLMLVLQPYVLANTTENETPEHSCYDLIRRIQTRDIYKQIDVITYSSSHLKEIFKKEEWTDDESKKIIKEFVDSFSKNADEEDKKDYEIKKVEIKFPSEECEDPVEEVYFFNKDDAAKPLPEGKKKAEDIKVSDLNTPKSFVEYRICHYYKGKSKEKELPKKSLEAIEKGIKEEFQTRYSVKFS